MVGPTVTGPTASHHHRPPQATWPSLVVLLVFFVDRGFVTVRECIKFGMGCGLWLSQVRCGLWVSQVRCGFDEFMGLSSPSWLSQVRWRWLGFELVWIVVSRFVLALGLRIMVDRRADRGSGDWFFFFFWWLCGGCFLWMWLLLVVFGGLNFVFFLFFFPSVVAISCGCGWWWIWWSELWVWCFFCRFFLWV